MAVAFGSAVSVTPSTGTQTAASPSITTPASRPIVIVCIGLASPTVTVSSLTITGFGGTPSEVISARHAEWVPGGQALGSVWMIDAPTANTAGTVRGVFSASVAYQMAVMTFSGVAASDPVPIGDAQTSIAAADLTLTPTNMVAGDFCAGLSANANSQDMTALTPNATFTDNTTAVNIAAGYGTTGGLTFASNQGRDYSKIAVRIRQFVTTKSLLWKPAAYLAPLIVR